MPKRELPDNGKLVVLSGPSGVGKGTLVGYILKRVPNVFYSISATTRGPREGERDGVDYYFRTRDAFEAEIKRGAFLEWARVYDDYYGTLIGPIVSALDEGKIVILEIDVQGAMQVKMRVGDSALYIFIAPPSVAELKRRLEVRDTEAASAKQKRMETAIGELEYAPEYDYVIVNDDLETAVEELSRILLTAVEVEDVSERKQVD